MKSFLETRDVILGAFLAVAGLVMTSSWFIGLFNDLNPLVGYFFSYVFFLIILALLAYFELVLFKFNIKSWSRFFGLFVITFALYIVTTWSSCYYELIQSGVCAVNPATADGAVFWLWSKVLAPSSVRNVQILRWLTYGLTPLVLGVLGGLFVKGKPDIGVEGDTSE